MIRRSTVFLVLSLFSMVLFMECAVSKNYKIAQKNKETIRLWFEEGWNKNKHEELLERCFDPNWKDGNPLVAEQLSGHEGMRTLMKGYKTGAPDAKFIITHLVADESQVAIRYEVAGTHTGLLFGIPATGRRFVTTGLAVYEMKDGRILISWQELDLSGLLTQLKD